jgi:hypothetical protein
MQVIAEMDRCGWLHVTPVSAKVREQMRKHLDEWTGNESETLFIQVDHEIDHFIDSYVPRAMREDLQHGWDVTFRMDPDTFGHHVGWDFHEVIDP